MRWVLVVITVIGLTTWERLPARGAQESESLQEPSGELGDEFQLLEEENQVESASLHKQEIGMSPSAIFVLTREDIEATGATNVVDLLRLVPGMDVKWNTQFYPSISCRFKNDDDGQRFMVLIDGREAFLDIAGNVPWMLQPILMEDIERIEVIRGPASALYGANAVAGVVNIFTRAIPNKTSAWGALQGGEIGFGSFGLRGSTKLGNLGLSISGGAEEKLRPLNLESWDRRAWRFRAVVDYRWSSAQSLSVDGGVSWDRGNLANAFGLMDTPAQLRTLRLSYHSATLQANLYWSQVVSDMSITAPLIYAGTTFAEIKDIGLESHTVDGQLQWQAPKFWEPLLIIIGGGARVSLLNSDQLLDGRTFADPTSSAYHQPGLSFLEVRGGVFLHSELAPRPWLNITADLRFDYNTLTEGFLSPHLAVVIKPASGQFLRLGAARAFRKPSFLESSAHGQVQFPRSSPIQGKAQENFQEFMSRILGNENLSNEVITSFDAGYLGSFFGDKLTISADLYFNIWDNVIYPVSNMVYKNGVPDITTSTFRMENHTEPLHFYGFEISARFKLSKQVLLSATWNHREAYSDLVQERPDSSTSPKNCLALGGRFNLSSRLVGSLYLFTRSAFWDPLPHNTGGLLSSAPLPYAKEQMLLFGKLGWRWLSSSGIEVETGIKLFVPMTPFGEPFFRYTEKVGAVNYRGEDVAGEEMRRMIVGYLEGSF